MRTGKPPRAPAADLLTPGERTFYTLDNAGNRILQEQQSWDGSDWATQAETGYLYASRCHLAKVLHPDSTVTEYAYDCNGNLERVWDAEHPSAGQTATPTTTYAYDALDRLTTVTRPWAGAGGGSSVTSYGYDVQDHLASVTDAEGSETTYVYSDRDLLTEEVSPVSGTTGHLYEEHGEQVSTTDARKRHRHPHARPPRRHRSPCPRRLPDRGPHDLLCPSRAIFSSALASVEGGAVGEVDAEPASVTTAVASPRIVPGTPFFEKNRLPTALYREFRHRIAFSPLTYASFSPDVPVLASMLPSWQHYRATGASAPRWSTPTSSTGEATECGAQPTRSAFDLPELKTLGWTPCRH